MLSALAMFSQAAAVVTIYATLGADGAMHLQSPWCYTKRVPHRIRTSCKNFQKRDEEGWSWP